MKVSLSFLKNQQCDVRFKCGLGGCYVRFNISSTANSMGVNSVCSYIDSLHIIFSSMQISGKLSSLRHLVSFFGK
jgi:hypothetical protein